jgi:hypothetical protein
MSDAPQIPVTQASVYIQPSGPGNPLKFIIGGGARGRLGAYSGGGIAGESLFSFGRAIGTRITQNPGRFTGQFAAPATAASEVRKLAKNIRCLFGIFDFAGCSPQDIDKFTLLRIFVDALITGQSPSGDLVDGITGEDPDQMDQIDFDALALIEAAPLSHAKASGTITTAAINHIIAIGAQNCAGACGPDNDGTQEFIAVGDAISPATIPMIYYTSDSGQSWVQQTIAVVTNGTAEAVAIVGNRVVVAVSGTTAGIYTAPLPDVKLGTAVFTLAANITTSMAFNDIVALDGATVLAVGAAGRIAYSTDGGYSFTILTSPVATVLSRVAVGSDRNLVWIGGVSGVVIRVKNLAVAEQIVVSAIGSDAVTAVAVPRDRTNEVYIGTATGEIHRARNAYDSVPTWQELSFDKPTGGGIIEDIQFADVRQQIMFVVQSNAATQSRVLVDYSGGQMAKWATAFGATFTSPANSIINSIAPVSANFAMTVGEPNGGQGFIGKIAG